jgi:hypothetical protein
MKADEPLAGPVIRSAWQPDPAGQAWPADVGTVALAALPTSPFRPVGIPAPSWIPVRESART